MKIKNIKVSLDCTVNIGNFENYKPSYTVEAEVQEGDNIQDCIQQLRVMVYAEISKDRQFIKSKIGGQK